MKTIDHLKPEYKRKYMNSKSFKGNRGALFALPTILILKWFVFNWIRGMEYCFNKHNLVMSES